MDQGLQLVRRFILHRQSQATEGRLVVLHPKMSPPQQRVTALARALPAPSADAAPPGSVCRDDPAGKGLVVGCHRWLHAPLNPFGHKKPLHSTLIRRNECRPECAC